jgi:hypothetical protein
MSDVQVSRQADRSRQGADAEIAEEARRVGPLQGRRRRRHPVPHDSRRRHAGVLHARLGPQREGAVQRAARRLRRTTWIGWRASSRRREVRAEAEVVDGRRREIGIIAYGTSHWAIVESRDQLARGDRRQDVVPAAAGVSVHEELGAFIDAHERVYVVEQNRDAQMLQLMKLELTPERSRSCAACCTTTACRSTRAASPTTSWRRKGFEVAKSARHRRASAMTGGEKRTWRHRRPQESESHRPRAADLSRRQDDALRRLRPQRDLRAHHRRVLRDGHRPEAGHQAVGHRLLEQEPGVLPRRLARLQLRARPHAVGRHRRDARQPRS